MDPSGRAACRRPLCFCQLGFSGRFPAVGETEHRERPGCVAAAVSITGVSVVDIDPDRTALDLSALILDLQAALGCAVDVKEVAGDGRDSERIRRGAIAL
jgi:hypothetical protein